MPREGAGGAVMIPHQLGPHAQSRFLGLRPSCRIQPHPALNPISPSVWNPTLEVQTTDKSSHAKWEFNCKQFLWIMGPSVPPYAKGKKKIPIKKKNSPCSTPQTDSKWSGCQGFGGWSQAQIRDASGGLPAEWAWQSQGAGGGTRGTADHHSVCLCKLPAF